MNILTALKTTLTAFPQVERRIALTQFLSRYINTNVRITNYRCIGKDADAIDTFLRSIGMDESVYTIVRSKFDNDTALIKWNTDNQEKVLAFTKSVSQAITVNSLTQLYSGIVLEPNEESIAQDVDAEAPREHWSESIQEITENILGKGVHAHFATLGEIERYAWENNLTDSSIKLPPVPLFFPKKDSYTGADVAVRYMKATDNLNFMPGLSSAPLRALLAATSELNPVNNFLYQTKDVLTSINDLPARNHLLVTTTGWVNTMGRLHAMRIIEFISNSKDLWAYISMLFRVVYKVHCTVTPWSRVAVNNIRTQVSSNIYPSELKHNGGWGEINCDVDNIGGSKHLAVFASVILTHQSEDSGNTPVPGYTNVQDVTPIPLITEKTNQSTDEAVVDRAFLDKRDLGGEWFATVHGLDMIVGSTDTPEERIEHFRKMYSELNPADYTKVHPVHDLTSSNPMQVFASGCAIAIRDFFNRVGIAPKFCDNANAIITDIYSGIVTDGSGSAVDYMCGVKTAFPDLVGREVLPSTISGFFSWLDTKEGSKAQLQVAPRSEVTKSRVYSVTIKTTLNADDFISAWRDGASMATKTCMREILGLSFLNAYVYKGCDPTAAAGLTTPPTEHTVQMLKRLLGEFDLPYPCVAADTALTQAKVLSPTRLVDFHSDENISVATTIVVRFMKDSENRLYITLGVPLNFAVTARLMYRTSNGLPIATRMLAQSIQAVSKTGATGFTTYTPDTERDSNIYYDKYIAAIMRDKCLRVPNVDDASRALRDYPKYNIGSTPETSILMNMWSAMYSKYFLTATGLNAYPGVDRNFLVKGGFVDIADDEVNKCLRVRDIVFGTSES